MLSFPRTVLSLKQSTEPMQVHGIFIAEPFLLVGLIAVVRRILLLTAEIEQASAEEFQNMLIELGVMTGLVIVLTGALYFTRRMRLSEKERESPG
jgi:hypothetical protein